MELVDIIFGPYFTKNIKFHQHDSSNGGRGGSKPNDYNQIKKWYESIQRLGMNAVIFHNENSDEFISKYTTDKIKFHRWEKIHRLSYNDERFYAYYEYLKLNPDINRVFCTDLYDVEFFRNPFDLMDEYPAHTLFLGEEMMSKSSSKWMIRKCKEMHTPQIKNKYQPGVNIYNAGIIGGKRANVIRLIKNMITVFKTIPNRFNANMPVFNYCVESNDDLIFSGHPLHNKFRSKKIDADTYIKHK